MGVSDLFWFCLGFWSIRPKLLCMLPLGLAVAQALECKEREWTTQRVQLGGVAVGVLPVSQITTFYYTIWFSIVILKPHCFNM